MIPTIRVAIVGYGNLGKGVELALHQSPDLKLVSVVSRRPQIHIHTLDVPVIPFDEIDTLADMVDVCILCGGSASDLMVQGPQLASKFCTVDSFDTHAKIPDYFAIMNTEAARGGRISLISVGWDPGLFSLQRLYASAILPVGHTETFWGKGVSQGHSDAIRRVPGVKEAIQYTIPCEESIDSVRRGENKVFTPRQKHTRECFVVPTADADKAYIEKTIREMPFYFTDYDTTVHFINESEFFKEHVDMPHGGFVIHSGTCADGTKHTIEYSLRLESNPSFTASVLVAYARAAYRLWAKGETGARTVLDIAPALLSSRPAAMLRQELL